MSGSFVRGRLPSPRSYVCWLTFVRRANQPPAGPPALPALPPPPGAPPPPGHQVVLYGGVGVATVPGGPWVAYQLVRTWTGPGMRPALGNAVQLAAWNWNVAAGGRDVWIRRGGWNPAQVFVLRRPSYVNAFLIQTVGQVHLYGLCVACSQARPGLAPFPHCLRIPGHFGGACGNCKWRDHAARCRWPDEEDGGDDDDGAGPVRDPGPPQTRLRDPDSRRRPNSPAGPRRLGGAGSAGNPIVL